MNVPAENDEAMIARLRLGDRAALADLFAFYRRPLERMIELRLDPRVKGRMSTSDILQEVFLDADQRLDHYLGKPEMPFLVWARLVTGQRLVDVHRQHLGAKMRDAGQEVHFDRQTMPGASSVCLAACLADSLSSPTHAVRQAELRARLHEALDQLDPMDREVLCLRHFEELSNRDTAAVLGIDTSAASKRYLRALARLKLVAESMPELRDD